MQGAHSALPQWSFIQGDLLFNRLPILGPALSITLTLHVALCLFILSPPTWSLFLSYEKGMKGQNIKISIFGGMFVFSLFFLEIGADFTGFWLISLGFWNQVELPVSLAALLLDLVVLSGLFMKPSPLVSAVHILLYPTITVFRMSALHAKL